MDEYRVKDTGDVKSQMQVRKMHPNVSLPKVWDSEICEALGVDPVSPSDRPEPSDNFKSVVRNGVEKNSDGNWVWAWTEQDQFKDYTDSDGNVVTAQAQKTENMALEARLARNSLLQDTDHHGLSDGTMSDAMKTYRQALRDVPQQAGFPSSITWPDKP